MDGRFKKIKRSDKIKINYYNIMSNSPSPSDDIKLAVNILKAKKQDELKELKRKLEAGDDEVIQVIEDPEQYMNNQDDDGDLANIVIFLYNGGIDNDIESFLISQINQLVKPTKKAMPSKKAISESKKASGKIKRRTYKKSKKSKKKPKSKRHGKSKKSRKGKKGRK